MPFEEKMDRFLDGEIPYFEWIYFLSLALILAFGTITTTGTVLNTDKPVVSVVSCSMYPVYHKGDILVVRGQEFSGIEESDIVVYEVPDRVNLEIDGRSYALERDSPDYNTTLQTEYGTISMVEVRSDLNTGNDRAILEGSGKTYTVTEGDSFELGEGTVSVGRISSMPIPVVHRVVEKHEDYLETRGDANNRQLDFESDVRPFQIHGTAVATIPRIGAVKILAMDFVGFQGDRPFVFDVYSPCR